MQHPHHTTPHAAILLYIHTQDAVLSQGGPRDAAAALYISIRIEFYNGIVRFLCHGTALLLVFVCRLQ